MHLAYTHMIQAGPLQVVTLLVGGGMALNGIIDGQTLTTFVFYVEFVTAASLSVCDQWGSIMEVGN